MMLDTELQEQEQNLLVEDSNSDVPPTDIVAFNELRSCADLVRMYKTNQLIIDPEFQRDVVWSPAAQTRFVDSLVKQLPIPSMCISLDFNTGERLMIDGLQRIYSIILFLTNDTWRLSRLDDVDKRISGRTPEHIKKAHKEVFERVQNLTIPITVLRCDYSKQTHMQYLFTIFHRLNTGGNKLTNQEIRNCIYSGSLNNLLKRIVAWDSFREVFSLQPTKSYRFSWEEMILRVLAFGKNYEDYNGRLSRFLNEYMDKYRYADNEEIAELENKIHDVIEVLYKKGLDGQLFPHLSKTTTEAILLGIFRNVENLKLIDDAEVAAMVQELRDDSLFSLENLKEGLSKKDRVITRLCRATEIFAG